MSPTSKVFLSLIFFNELGRISGWFDVFLFAPSYVTVGGSASLVCRHNVPSEVVHKIEWHRDDNKFFQYVNKRRPPFRVFPVSWAVISERSEREVSLKNLTMEATGLFSCEVSTDTPIFTKASEYHHLTVSEGLRGIPQINFGQPSYKVGEWLKANCSLPPNAAALPSQVVWLINGTKVDDQWVRKLRGRTTELNMRLSENHSPHLRLTCLTYLPGGQRTRSSTIPINVSDPPVKHTKINCKSAASSISSLLFLHSILYWI